MIQMSIEQQQKYVKSHGVLLKNGQVFLEKPLFAFKKVHTYSSPKDYLFDDLKNNTMAKPRTSSKVKSFINKMETDFRWTSYNKSEAIANLIIPAGAIVNLPSLVSYERKMRSSHAYSHSVVRLSDNKMVPIGLSGYDKSFPYFSISEFGFNGTIDDEYTKKFYIPGKEDVDYNFLLQPTSFDGSTLTCRAGIHFFLELDDALEY